VEKDIKIGILETGVSGPEFEKYGAHASWFVTMLSNISDSFSYKVYHAHQGETPPTADTCDAYIISGSASSVLDPDPWIETLSGFLRDAITKQPVVGICFGHQLLHQIHGGKVEKSTKGWGIGVHEYDVTARMSWMAPPIDKVGLLVSHMDQVVETAPESTILAGSNFCPNAITMIGPNMLTLQAHPEHTKEFAFDLYNSRRTRIGNGQVDAAVKSLQQPTSEGQVAAWIAQFISSRI
jgi:GMP synthase-like glutamine amidotransferase